jgi:UDP-N-acetylmuramoyl-L-alanyl-D-glutamate--2,6-diaminopimelate ligase
MDYHPTVEDYLQAKMRLFADLMQPGQTAVINADGAYAERVIETAKQRGLKVYTVGAAGKDLRRVSLQNEGFAQVMQIEAAGRTYDVRLPLVGAYQVENALTAAGLVIATGENVDAVLSALETLKGVPGRLEIIGEANGGLAIVDYAHKPEAVCHR